MIRAYRREDLEDLLAVWGAASAVAHPFLGPEFLAVERERIPREHLPAAETWVWDDGGWVVGFIALAGNEVGALFVDPARHGQGIGRALVDHARRTRRHLELEVFEANALGRRFYDRYGFRRVGRRVHEETGLVLLRLALGPADGSDPEGDAPGSG